MLTDEEIIDSVFTCAERTALVLRGLVLGVAVSGGDKYVSVYQKQPDARLPRRHLAFIECFTGTAIMTAEFRAHYGYTGGDVATKETALAVLLENV